MQSSLDDVFEFMYKNESSIPSSIKKSEGVVYTPRYIADYIINTIFVLVLKSLNIMVIDVS